MLRLEGYGTSGVGSGCGGGFGDGYIGDGGCVLPIVTKRMCTGYRYYRHLSARCKHTDEYGNGYGRAFFSTSANVVNPDGEGVVIWSLIRCY